MHNIETKQDQHGKWHWRIVLYNKILGAEFFIAESSEEYTTRKEMLNDLFGLFFGTYDDSFLTLYAEWNPDESHSEPATAHAQD